VLISQSSFNKFLQTVREFLAKSLDHIDVAINWFF
jgi:hypothetical protein